MALSPTKNPVAGKKGQAFIETLVSLPFFLLGLMALFGLLYMIMAQFLIEHWVYQSGICLAKARPRTECERELRQYLAHLPFHQVQQLGLHRSSYQISVNLGIKQPNQSESQFRLKLPYPPIEGR